MQSKYWHLLMQMPADGSAISAKELAAHLGVSSRSIVSYVGDIVSEHPGLIHSTNRGYCLEVELFGQVQSTARDLFPDTSEKRALYMIRRTLENETKPFYITDFEEELFVGESTLRKDLPLMRQKLKDFDLFLDQRKGRLIINGDESSKRRMLSEVIYLEFNNNILSISAMTKAFPGYDAVALRELLIDVCHEHHYFINEFALMNLVLDLLISIDRIKNNHLSLPKKRIYRFGEREQDLARAIIHNLEELYGVGFNQLETDELTALLFGRMTKIDYDTLTLSNVGEVVSQKTMRIVALIEQELEAFDFLDFANPELLLRFTVHIDNLLKRLENHYDTKNPLTDKIREGCTFIYELAVTIADIINRETGHFVDPHETAYIAIHIGGMLQMQQSLRNKARCLLVFPQYYNYANKLIEQLTHTFGTSLFFEGIVTHPEEIDQYEAVDMILTTVEISPSRAVETVNISPFLGERDRSAIQNGLDNVVWKKKAERVRKSLLEISSPAMFSLNQAFTDEYAAIAFMADKMVGQGYAGESFLDSVYARERSYSTAYGDVAVPHSLQMDAKKTGMYICINERPVPWGERHVRVMLLFSVNRDDKSTFYEVFENLIVSLLEPENVKRVASCKTYDQFVNTILHCL